MRHTVGTSTRLGHFSARLVGLATLATSLMGANLALADSEENPSAVVVAVVVEDSSSCTLGFHDGVSEAQAATAKRIVCDEIARFRVGGQIRVDFERLDSKIILRVGREGTSDSRRMILANLDEVLSAAPRLAETLATGTTIADTVTVDTVTAEESKIANKRAGHFVWGVGLLTTFLGSDVGGGITAPWFFETSTFAFGATLQTSFSTADRGGAIAFSVGARRFLGLSDSAAFFGGGMSYLALSSRVDPATDRGVQIRGNGMAVYTEVGVEMFRTFKHHLLLSLRADIPFFSLNGTSYDYSSYDSTGRGTSTALTSYELPITLQLTYLR